MSCIVTGGTYSGKRCIGLGEQQCEVLRKSNLKECPECRAEFESLKTGGDLSTVEKEPDTKPFKIMMKRMNRQFYSLAYAALIFLIFLGFGWTGGENLMYNSVIMPIVGIFGYYVFRWKAIYKMPVLLLLIDLAVAALVIAVILAYRGKSLLTVSLAASAAVIVTEWVLAFFA